MNCHFKTFLLVELMFLVSKHVTSQIPTQPTYLNINCAYSYFGNYTKNSTYNDNLNLVLSDLVSNASAAQFFNTSAGLIGDTAYGEYYCRGDISAHLCHDCVKAASRIASEGGDCFGVKGGVIWFQECTFHYDNKSNVGFWDQAWTANPVEWWSYQNVSDPVKFNQVVPTLMDSLIKKAAYGGEPKEFATGEKELDKYATVYCMVQCSPDIVGSTCESCLRVGVRSLVAKFSTETPDWMFLFYPKCHLRYSLSAFYIISDAPPPTSSTTPPSSGKKSILTRIVVPVAVGSIFLVCGISFGVWFCLYKTRKNSPNTSQIQAQTRSSGREDSNIGNIECFNLRSIEDATIKFSLDNKLGEGGFGSVYKGILPNGNLVAIKRLSRNSGQGIKEFKTEVAVVGKLQHRNLVRLVGFCVEDEERILVYDFLPNLSLDKFLFDDVKSVELGWRTRHKIIEGIAWGLRYLHIDSLLTIVHQDLKSSNILLDHDMNPKIADFGMAKLVQVDETTGNTSRIVGTYGYMAPEYAMTGRFSIKSDIYSLGVIILEILSGKSISQFSNPINGAGLLQHAWEVWKEKAIEKLVDPSLQHNYSKIEAERCLQIGLLCVQDDPTIRPTIRVVVGMLENQSLELQFPPVPSSFSSPRTSIPSSDTQSVQIRQSRRAEFYDSSDTHFDNLRPR